MYAIVEEYCKNGIAVHTRSRKRDAHKLAVNLLKVQLDGEELDKAINKLTQTRKQLEEGYDHITYKKWKVYIRFVSTTKPSTLWSA